MKMLTSVLMGIGGTFFRSSLTQWNAYDEETHFMLLVKIVKLKISFRINPCPQIERDYLILTCFFIFGPFPRWIRQNRHLMISLVISH